jgi:thioredoxin reductase
MTTVEEVYAARDITRGTHNVSFAFGDGVMAATAIRRSLIFDEHK